MGRRPDRRAAAGRLGPLRDDEEDRDARGEAGLTGDGDASPAPRRIVFSHANGFPAGTYRQIFELWRAAGWEVHAIEKIGHDPRYPVSVDWPRLVDQLIGFVEAEAGGPALLVGHSLGGYLSLMAAARRPDLASGVVLLDSPIVAGWKAQALRLLRGTGLADRLSPARVSRRRRHEWPDAAAVHAHFAAKPVFAGWAEGVLADYVRAGTEPHAGMRRLAFDRGIESAIYQTLPARTARLLREHPLRCEAAFVRGSRSNEVRQAGAAATERVVGGRVSMLEGSHLFPFERPRETAQVVLDWAARLRGPAPTGLL